MSGISVSFPAWVFGFKNRINADDWYRDVAYIILGNFESIPRRPNTTIAESGLGIRASWYSYIAKAVALYGNGLFFLQIDPARYGLGDGGICPFDSGGIWWGHIETNPRLITEIEKREFFYTYNKPLSEWPDHFRAYVHANYFSFSNYVHGEPP